MAKRLALSPAISEPTKYFSNRPGGEEFNTYGWQQVASGYAAVWATENTREAIFAAMQRKEVYATTGSRIAVRLFGGWKFEDEDLLKPNAARIGYRKGVPMGGDLPPKQSPAPGFLVWAVKDPNGANLDRIQIVKGWRDADGNLREQTYNVAPSTGGRINRDGKLEAIESTVDTDKASYSNNVGDAQLAAFWTDPDFVPNEQAFYYARVLEIPTPRWSTLEKVRFGATLMEDTPLEIQDRAYTSPIWYTPQGQL